MIAVQIYLQIYQAEEIIERGRLGYKTTSDRCRDWDNRRPVTFPVPPDFTVKIVDQIISRKNLFRLRSFVFCLRKASEGAFFMTIH